MGQGYLSFSDSASTAIWDNFTTPGTAVKSPANVIVGLLWNATSGQTNSSLGGSASGLGTAGSWAGVAGNGWSLALQSGTPITALTRTGLPLGTFSGGVVGIDGTSAGETISVYVVAWLASSGAAGFGNSTVLGWSNPINEQLGASSAPGLALSASMSGPVYVNAVPEPATFALAGLGAAAMLIFRRRK